MHQGIKGGEVGAKWAWVVSASVDGSRTNQGRGHGDVVQCVSRVGGHVVG